MNDHRPELGKVETAYATSVKCQHDGCFYILTAGRQLDAFYLAEFAEHAGQYEPGRAPDITVEWEISATCSVCEDGGNVDTNDSDSVICKDCGTTWYMDGKSGERDV